MSKLNLEMSLKWLNMNSMPRKTVFELQKDLQDKVFTPFQQIFNTLESTGLITQAGKKILDNMVDCFITDDTEYKFKQKWEELDLYANAREFVISNQLQPGVVHNEQQMENDPITGILMPIKFQLRKYLESPNVFKAVLHHLTPSGDGYIRTVVDGSIWKMRAAKMGSNIIIPLNLFFDDFNTTDTVSAHASSTSICGIYYYIPCLPGYVLSKLINILVAGYVLSEDRKFYGNEDLFTNLIEILIDLETEGLEITYEGQQIRVYFMLAFITGDNLGLSGILDLTESVRAHYYCRRCKRNREQREEDVVEYGDSLRTIQNYEYDLMLQDVSKTGIKNNSIFNKIPSFHIVYNVYFDLMHDLWEGVCVYGLGHCLNYFINVKKYLRLDELNRRKNMFVFGNLNSSNMPNDIKDINLSKSKIKMTASEVKTFVKFLPLIIGDKIPTNDNVWLSYPTLKNPLSITELHPAQKQFPCAVESHPTTTRALMPSGVHTVLRTPLKQTWIVVVLKLSQPLQDPPLVDSTDSNVQTTAARRQQQPSTQLKHSQSDQHQRKLTSRSTYRRPFTSRPPVRGWKADSCTRYSHKPGKAAHTDSRARHSYQRSGRPTAAVLYSHRWKDSHSTPLAAAHTATASSMTPTTALVTVTSIIQQRNAVRRQFQRTGCLLKKQELSLLNNQIKNRMHEIRNKQFSQDIRRLDDHSRPFWKVAKILKKRPQAVPPLKDEVDGLLVSPLEKANAIASKLVEAHNLGASMPSPHEEAVRRTINQLDDNDEAPFDGQVTEDEVRSAIKRTKNMKAPGNDGIFNLVLKKLSSKSNRFLAAIFTRISGLHRSAEIKLVSDRFEEAIGSFIAKAELSEHPLIRALVT
nr:uncharacterized protein LOC115263789 [Aedes albopictus]